MPKPSSLSDLLPATKIWFNCQVIVLHSVVTMRNNQNKVWWYQYFNSVLC